MAYVVVVKKNKNNHWLNIISLYDIQSGCTNGITKLITKGGVDNKYIKKYHASQPGFSNFLKNG